MSSAIHPTAIIEPGASLGTDVSVGPFCVVGDGAVLGDGVKLHSHVVIAGRTRIGARTQVYPFAVLGHPPQDLKFRGEVSDLIIGSDCTIREWFREITALKKLASHGDSSDSAKDDGASS
jgi:UDP-N-acetylglucosamine acyltransferase